MKAWLYAWVLSLVVLGVQPAQGNGLKAVKGKVGDATARWLSKVGRPALALSFGAMLVLAPLISVDANQYAESAERSRLKTNLELKGEIDALGIGLAVDKNGEVVRSETNPLADLLPSKESGERLRIMTILAQLEAADAAGLFKRGSGVSRRLERIAEYGDHLIKSDDDISSELRVYFTKSWKDLALNELRLDMHLLKDDAARKIFLDAFPQELGAAAFTNRTATSRKLKQAVAEQQRLLSKLLQGDISKEKFEQEYAGIEDKIISAMRDGRVKKHISASGTSRLPHIRTGW